MGIVSLIVILASSARGVEAQAPSQSAVAELNERVRAVVTAHNRERREAGLTALKLNAKLTAAARAHAADMAKRDKMSHTGGDGSTPFDRMKSAGYRYRRAAENIARGQFTTAKLMTMWMNSPPHKRNILGSYTEIGAACATDAAGQSYWCVDFGTPRVE